MNANVRQPDPPLTKQECLDLLQASTVGRIGFNHPDGIKILPVNYVIAGDEIIIRTGPSGTIAALADDHQEVAFEVDYHNSVGGYGWSVLLNGPIRLLTQAELENLHLPSRIVPWVGGGRTLHLRFTPSRVNGRRVHRRRPRP